MNKIYSVYKNYQMTDSDSWQYWVQQEILSYFSSIEKAQSAVKVLIADAVKLRLEQMERVNARNPNTYTEKGIKEVVDELYKNIIVLFEGNNGRDSEKYPLFEIREITVL